MPKGQSYMLVMMLLMLLIMADPSISMLLGTGMGILLTPTIGFGGHMPVVSILCAGLLTGLLSTGLRHWATDYVALERGRILQRMFNKELMDARAKRDDDRVARLKRAQPFMMSHTMSAQYATMKPAVYTMVIALAVYAWMNLFLRDTVPTTAISLPWAIAWPLPPGSLQMMFLYAIMALPATLVTSHVLKLYRFRNFDPEAALTEVPSVADLVARAEGDIDNEDVLAKESDKARRRLKGAPVVVDEDDGEDATIEDADEDDIEIIDPEEEGGKRAKAPPARASAVTAMLADPKRGRPRGREEE